MFTYLVESNLRSWAVVAPDEMTAACGWIAAGMGGLPEAAAKLARVRRIDSAAAIYPLKGVDGAQLIAFMARHREAIDVASQTCRTVSHMERLAHQRSIDRQSAADRLRAVEDACRGAEARLSRITDAPAAVHGAIQDVRALLRGALATGTPPAVEARP